MTPDTALQVMQEALWVTVLLASIPLIAALGVGLLVAIFQAATQINEMTLSFVPKLIVMAVAMVISGPWMLGLIIDFTQRLITSIPELIG